jgi:hypothetical protein
MTAVQQPVGGVLESGHQTLDQFLAPKLMALRRKHTLGQRERGTSADSAPAPNNPERRLVADSVHAVTPSPEKCSRRVG